MYKFITILMWIALVVIPFIRSFCFNNTNQSKSYYISSLKESFIFAWIGFKIEGVEDIGEAFYFLISLFVYIFISFIISLFWIVVLPILILLLLIKKFLKKK